jgi:outer membrane lipoprotein-sorting protein
MSESELGQLLELLYGARWRFRTARGVLYHRGSRRLGREAMEREMERANRRGGGRVMRQVTLYGAGGGEEPQDLQEERLRFWWEPPGRLREEVEYETHGSQRISVHDGELWWLYTPQQGAISNVELDAEERAQYGAGGGERFKPLLEPSGFLVAFEFGAISHEDGLLRVRARPRRDDVEATVGHLHLRLGGADEFELEVDAEVGIIRRLTAFFDGQELSSTELTELVLDEAFPEETFVFVPPPGEEVLPPESLQQRRQYTLEEAAAEAPFTVFYVPELPEGHWRRMIRFHGARRRPPPGANVGLIYSRPDGRESLILMQQAVAEATRGIAWAGSPPEAEEVERDGVRYLVAHGDPTHGRQNQVVFERAGTRLELRSELDAETLLALAANLQPVGDGLRTS